MCKILEDLFREESEEAIRKEHIELACKMIASGKFSVDEIAEYSKLSIEEVRMLANQQSA